MSGIELAHELKKRMPQMPVLLTTGYANPSVGHTPPEGSTIIKKPYGLQELEAAIRGLQPE
jgi:DNA-binding LytR/AlgR family response regulator